jgi:hypothetical protein
MKATGKLVAMMLLATAMFAVSCGGNAKKKAADGSTETAQTEQAATTAPAPTSVIEAAFKQFGLNVSQIKPNVGTPDETTVEYGNKVDNNVYLRKAAYKEKSDGRIGNEVGNAYAKKMFDLCKSASADGKVYTNKTNSGDNVSELASPADVTGRAITWSYKIDGMWVDVYIDWVTDSNEIGIRLNGSESY